MTAALMESIIGSICSEAAQPQKFVGNLSEHGSDGQSEQEQRRGVVCDARKQGWTRLSGAMCMLVSRALSSWEQLTLAAACARVISRIHPGLSCVL